MESYFDSAIIVKLYVQEANSAVAIRLASGLAAPYALTSWQVLEVRNAIRLKTFRREITPAEMIQSIAAFAHDRATDRWLRPAYSVATVKQKAGELFRRPRRHARLPRARPHPCGGGPRHRGERVRDLRSPAVRAGQVRRPGRQALTGVGTPR